MSRTLSGQVCRGRTVVHRKGFQYATFSYSRHVSVYQSQRNVGGRHSVACCSTQPDTLSDQQQQQQHNVGSATTTTTTEFEELHGDSFWNVLGEQPKNQLNVVICYTSKCMPCKQVKPIMAAWEQELVHEQGKHVKMFQFALTMPNKDCALAMDVRSSPTFLVLRDGEIVHRGKGKAAVDDLKDYIFENA